MSNKPLGVGMATLNSGYTVIKENTKDVELHRKVNKSAYMKELIMSMVQGWNGGYYDAGSHIALVDFAEKVTEELDKRGYFNE